MPSLIFILVPILLPVIVGILLLIFPIEDARNEIFVLKLWLFSIPSLFCGF